MKMCLNRYHDFFLVVYQFVSDNCNMSTTTSSASSPLYQLRSQGHPEILLLFFIVINIFLIMHNEAYCGIFIYIHNNNSAGASSQCY